MICGVAERKNGPVASPDSQKTACQSHPARYCLSETIPRRTTRETWATMFGRRVSDWRRHHAGSFDSYRRGSDPLRSARRCIGADFNHPKRHHSFHRTFNSAHFNHDDLHDDLQFTVRALPIVMRRDPFCAAWLSCGEPPTRCRECSFGWVVHIVLHQPAASVFGRLRARIAVTIISQKPQASDSHLNHLRRNPDRALPGHQMLV